MNVTLFKSITDNDKPYVIPLETALRRIVTGSGGKPLTVKKTTEYLRREKDKSKRQSVKAENLPVVMFSGEFTVKQKSKKTGEPTFMQEDCLAQHSGLIVLDWDGVKNPDSLKSYLSGIDFIHACWVSPSGGIKALVRIAQTDKHRQHFNALRKYFPEIDQSGANVNRNCYESYDPSLYWNKESKVFDEIVEEVKKVSSKKHNHKLLDISLTMIKNSVDGEKWDKLRNASRLAGGYVASGLLNQQKAEEELKKAIAARLGSDTSRDYYHSLSAIHDGMQHGLGEPLEEIQGDIEDQERLRRVSSMDIDSYVDSPDEMEDMIERDIAGTLPTGRRLPNNELSEYFVYKEQSLICNLGHSNTGKSFLSWYLLCLAAKHFGWKIGVYSGENTTWRIHKKMAEFYMGMPVSLMKKEEKDKAMEFARSHFFLVTNKRTYNSMSIIDVASKLVADESVNYFLVDPFNALNRSKEDAHREEYEIIGEMFSWTKREGCGMWVNMHTYTEAQRRTGSNKLQERPSAPDAEGGGKFVNRCDDFFVTHRLIHGTGGEENITEFYVDKVREKEMGGKPTPKESPLQFELSENLCRFLFIEKGGKRVDLMNPRVGGSL